MSTEQAAGRATLRERLREEDPSLWRALERSWDLARDHWLPAFAVSAGSHTGYPHFAHLEAHLNRLDRVFGGPPRGAGFRLTPTETYLMLAAILFHDIGKVSGPGKLAHGKEGEDFLRAHWADCGIPSRELGAVIAELAHCHDWKDDRDGGAKKRLGSLHSCAIDPYGRIRQRHLASELIVVEELDTSYLRALPADFGDGLKAFRRLIRDIDLDAGGRVIRCVLDD